MSTSDLDFEKQTAVELEKFNLLKERVLSQEVLDEDGYPTEAALELIRGWHWSDCHGWFDFIKSIWWMSGWGWHESSVPHDYNPEKTVHQYNISTGGWSGNEAIISAMQQNRLLWSLQWVQSRRGGHYIFELRAE